MRAPAPHGAPALRVFRATTRPRASDLWVQASLDYKQRLQRLFFPEGIAFDGNRFNRTAVTAPLFNCLELSESADERVVSRMFASWNQLDTWVRQVEALRRAAWAARLVSRRHCLGQPQEDEDRAVQRFQFVPVQPSDDLSEPRSRDGRELVHHQPAG